MATPDGNGPFSLASHPAHLGLGATTIPQPTFTGDMTWYGGYGERHGGEGHDGRLLSIHTFTTPWDMWEMHPNGSEVVLVTTGKLTLIQEANGKPVRIDLRAGEYAINPSGIWHTADADQPATAVFITSGIGTEHRPR